MKTYDPFPHNPTSVPRVNVCAFMRPIRHASFGVINLPDPKAPRVKYVGKGKKRVRRITVK